MIWEGTFLILLFKVEKAELARTALSMPSYVDGGESSDDEVDSEYGGRVVRMGSSGYSGG